MPPRVSVLTPTLNGAAFLRQCIESVLVQGEVPFEHIVMDGGSTDGTQELLASYPHLIWRSEKDSGEADALNKAAALATGEVLLWLNGDDWLEPDAFRQALSALNAHPEAAVLCGSARMVDEDGRELWVKRPLPAMNLGLLMRWWLNPAHPHQPAMFIRRKALEAIGPFRTDLHFSIDYELWLRLACRFAFHVIPPVLANARLRPNAKSSGTEQSQVQSHWKVLEPYLSALPDDQRAAFWQDYFMWCASSGQAPEPWTGGAPGAQQGKAWALLRLGALPQANQVWWEMGAQSVGVATAFQPERAPVAPTPKPPSTIRIAGEGVTDRDLTEVAGDSAFARALQRAFKEHRPRRLLETGTYHGTGTTAVIARTLKALGLTDATFYSIEVNPANHLLARRNLSALGLLDTVTPLLGLSVPRELLPQETDIAEALVDHLERDYHDVFVDHQPGDRARLYHQETAFEEVPDDLLGRCLKVFEYQPDFVLLDSGGHMGFVEFRYLIEHLDSPCLIALDDIAHVKHARSFALMKGDPRFTLLEVSDEKFGFALARFDPGPIMARPSAPRILWIRPDAIGDAVLAASMLPHVATRHPKAEIHVLCQAHVAPLYEACPHVKGCLTFNRSDLGRPEAVQALLAKVRDLRADHCYCSVYSREPLADAAALASGAPIRVAFEGDDVNMTVEQKAQMAGAWTRLLPSDGDWKAEPDRHREFLAALGIEVPDGTLQPLAWTQPADEAFAEALLTEHRLDPTRTMALFAGAGFDLRVYPRYAEALKPWTEAGYTFLALGSEAEASLHAGILSELPGQHPNLCGRLTLLQNAALLRRLRLGVGAESALAHLCAAVGTPHVVVIGGGHFARFMPYSNLTTLAALPLDCWFCHWRCPHSRAHCVKDLHPDVLRAAVEATLDGPSPLPRLYTQAGGWTETTPAPLDLAALLDGSHITLTAVRVPDAQAREPIPPPEPARPEATPIAPRTTVICGVWHQDPERFERLRAHQACLDAQTVPVERLYVFDGGDQAPAWLNGQWVSTQRGLALYEAWDLAFHLARTPFVMNLNLDDRLATDAVAHLEAALDAGADLAGGDWRICFSQAETDVLTLSEPATSLPFHPEWPPAHPTRLGSGTGERGTYGPATLWRLDLRRRLPRYPWRFKDGSPVKIIGDAVWWELLLRSGAKLVRVPRLLGRYFSHPAEQAEFRTPADREHAKLAEVGLDLV